MGSSSQIQVSYFIEDILKENEELLFRALNELLKFIKKLNTRYITPENKWGNVSFLTKCCIAFG